MPKKKTTFKIAHYFERRLDKDLNVIYNEICIFICIRTEYYSWGCINC